MSDLGNLQGDIFASLFAEPKKMLKTVIPSKNGINVSERLDVHRQTVIYNLVNMLKNIYPGIWKLIGEDCARGAAKAYIHKMENLPLNGIMENFGENFADFISSFQSTKNLPYLTIYAQYEWIKSKAYHSRILKTLNIVELSSFSEEELANLTINFNPSVRFIAPKIDILQLQSIVDGTYTEEVSLVKEQCYFIIYQKQGVVETRRLERDVWDFLIALRNFEKLEKATKNCLDNNEEKFTNILQFIFKQQLVQSIKIAGSHD